MLKLKHPEPREPTPEMLAQGPFPSAAFENINYLGLM